MWPLVVRVVLLKTQRWTGGINVNYQVQISLNDKFTELVINKYVEDVNDTKITKDLEFYTVYHWRVRTINSMTGTKSRWSEPCVFRIQSEDVIINHEVDRHICDELNFDRVFNSYIVYETLEHEFVRSYDTHCVIPDAEIGACLCPTSAVAEIGISDLCGCGCGEKSGYCVGECKPKWDGLDIEFLYTEDKQALITEDGIDLILEESIN